MNYGTLQLGAVAAIDFMVRNIMSAMMELMSKASTGQVLFSSVFEDIDDYIYYLFNIYQLLEV
jgi:hypothetical protein